MRTMSQRERPGNVFLCRLRTPQSCLFTPNVKQCLWKTKYFLFLQYAYRYVYVCIYVQTHVRRTCHCGDLKVLGYECFSPLACVARTEVTVVKPCAALQNALGMLQLPLAQKHILDIKIKMLFENASFNPVFICQSQWWSQNLSQLSRDAERSRTKLHRS